jgi:uncharacterized integral membrane protein
MPWKFLGFLLILAVFVVFAGLNVENVSDISFGFVTLEEVPIFLSLSLSFILGAVLMLPFTLTKYFKKGIKKPKEKKTGKKKRGKNKDKDQVDETGAAEQENIIDEVPSADTAQEEEQ